MTESRIVRVIGRRVWDSRGRPTVEAEVYLAGGARGRAIAPAGASTGGGEAVDLRDGGVAFGGRDVLGAVAGMNGEIAEALIGRDAQDQSAVDRVLIKLDGTADKRRLGGNALVAISMAVARAAAAAAGVPLWVHLGGRELPLPQIQIFGGGAHAHNRVDLQDFMVIAAGAESFRQALEWTAEVYAAAGTIMAERGLLCGVADEGGYWPAFTGNEEAISTLAMAIDRAGLRPGEDMAIALDVAANGFRTAEGYHLAAEGRHLDREGLIAMLREWVRRYPIVSIEDPVAEDDPEGFAAATEALGPHVQVVADDFLVTNAGRITEAAAAGAGTAALLKPNQAGTLTETRAAFAAARSAGWGTIVSARSGESEDTTVVDLAVGWEAGQLKVGSFARSERMAKWNHGLRIEEALGKKARFAGGGALVRAAARS